MSSHDLRAFSHASPGDPLCFGSGSQRLFGWLHQPSAGTARDLGLVICQPFGYESFCAHQGMRAFAETAASSGVPSLRFDYLGTGDSADIDPEADQLQTWSNDVIAAVEELQRITGVGRVCLLGVRLGSVLALRAAAHCRAVTGVVLISPVIKGRRYLRDLNRTRLAASLASGEHGSPGSASADSSSTAGGGSLEVSGFTLSGATVAALAQVDLTAQSAPPLQMLIIDGNSMPVARQWADALVAAGARTQYLSLPGLVEMIMTMPHDARPPLAMIAAVRGWLENTVDHPRPGRAASPQRAQLSPPAAVLDLPCNMPGEDTRITEQPVFILQAPKVFAIVTRPRREEERRRAVILLNAGATYHAGPNRVHVSLARRWARSGYVIMRMDLAGLGDSGTRAGAADNDVFPPAAVDDIRAAVEFLRVNCGISEVTLCGFCSGAYHTLRAAAAGVAVQRLLMVNPDFWKAGTPLDALQPTEVVRRIERHRRQIFSATAWKRILTGEINIWRIVRIYLQRPLLALEAQGRNLARLLHVRVPNDLGSDLEEIAARGARLVFIFARGEAGIELLRMQGGVSLRRLKDRCRVHIIDNADHIFSQATQRALLEATLTTELLAAVDTDYGGGKIARAGLEPGF